MRYTSVLGWSSLAAVAVSLAMPAHAADTADADSTPQAADKNLTDKAYRTQSLPTVFFQGWAAPATVTVSVGAKF